MTIGSGGKCKLEVTYLPTSGITLTANYYSIIGNKERSIFSEHSCSMHFVDGNINI